MIPLGSSLHWATVLPDGYRLRTRPDIAALVGWEESDVVLDWNCAGPGHYASGAAERLRHARMAVRDMPPRFCNQWIGGGKVVLCKKGSRPEKNWNNWDELEHGLNMHSVAFEPQTDGPLPDLEQQLINARAVVAIDSGPMHLASYIGAPTVGVFVSTDPARFGPRGPRSCAVVSPTAATVLLALISILGGFYGRNK